MRAKAAEKIDVFSGGTDPGDELWGPAREAAAEFGASMDGEFPKPISDEILMNSTRIVILGDAAKVSPRDGMVGSIETWLTPSPGPEVGDELAQARIIRDDISRRVDALFEELTTK